MRPADASSASLTGGKVPSLEELRELMQLKNELNQMYSADECAANNGAAMSERTAMEPNWKPLENRLGAARCAGFMFMGRVEWHQSLQTRNQSQLSEPG